jgi:hypothetical protein
MKRDQAIHASVAPLLVLLLGLWLGLLPRPAGLLAEDAFTCKTVQYRNPAEPDKAGWLVREEKGRQLTVHVGNNDAFDSIYIRVYGQAKWQALGFSRFLRLGRNWQDALKAAADACSEWTKKNAAPAQQQVVPPVQSAPQPPVLAEMVVEQRHLVREKAQFRVSARAEYRDIGAFRPGDITFTVRAQPGRGRNDLSWTLRPGDREVRQQGNLLLLEFQGEIVRPGTYAVSVVLRDSRFRSGAHGSLAYEDRLRLTMQVQPPAAEIKEASGNVSLMRIEPATAAGGVRVKAGGRVHPRSRPDLVQDIEFLRGEWRPDPYAGEQHRWEKASSRFVYEGDKIAMWGERDRARIREFMDSGGVAGHSVDELIAVMSSGTSRVVLEWRSGLKGEAIWNPRQGMAEMSGEFVVGASRDTSGKWRQKWQELFGQGCQALFEQGVDAAKDEAVEWLLGFSPPSGGPYVSLFNFGAGDTAHDDLIYVRLNSRVYLRGGRGQVDLFTLEGRPELVDARTGRRTVVPAGQRATAKRGAVPTPRPFAGRDLVPPHWSAAPAARERADAKTPRPTIAGLPVTPAGVRFFESGKGMPPFAERKYRKRFFADEARYVNWELRLTYPAPGRRLKFQVSGVLLDSQGKELARPEWSSTLEKDWTDSHHPYGWGDDKPGFWKPGVYALRLYLDGREIARDSFEIVAGNGGAGTRIAALDADIVTFALFAGGRTPPPFAQRRFGDSFAARETRYINWHLQLAHRPRRSPLALAVETVWRRADGHEVARHSNPFTMPAGAAATVYDSGWGNDQGNFWQPGSYRVSLYLDGVEIASRSFKVTAGAAP